MKKFFYWIFISLIPLLAKGEEGDEVGALIILSAQGSYEILDSKGKILSKNLSPGSVLRDGLTVVTGETGQISLLFSNGFISTIQSKSKLEISSFKQEPFKANDKLMKDVIIEPSNSSIDLKLEFGNLTFKTKKLNPASSFGVKTKAGVAGIRGTEFQIAQSPDGACKVDVASSAVSFVDSKGGISVVPAGKGLDVSNDGKTSERNISPEAQKSIQALNSASVEIANQISLNVVNDAVEKAAKILAAITNQQDKSNDEETTEEEKDDDSILASNGNEVRANFSRTQSLIKQRMISGDETAQIALSSKIYSVSYSFDEDTDEIIIFFYDKGGNFVNSVRISIFDHEFELILDTLEPWLTDHDKTIDALALEVFMEQLSLGYAYDKGINDALQSAINFARIFLNDVTLSGNLPKVWKVSDLVREFSENPYAYEFGLLLSKYGAIGNESSVANGQTIESIGLNIIKVLGGREKLKDENYLNSILTASISPLDSINGEKINGNVLGTRSLSSNSIDDLSNLKVELDRVVAVVGSTITLEQNAIIDPSLTDEKNNQIFSIAAAKDLVIKGNLEFQNSLNSKQAIAIGAANELVIRSESISDYFDANFVSHYLNQSVDPIFLSADEINPQISPDPVHIINHGYDLGLGSSNKMELIDVDISTNGNLAVGTLSELKILSTRFDESIEFSDTNIETVLNLNTLNAGNANDEGNIYLYAHDRIAVNGLGFGNSVREIYMDANTIDLKNVKFPDSSEVTLRSKYGYPTFGHENREVGHVNFIKNVYHGNDMVNPSFFHQDSRTSLKKIGSSPALKIRSN